MENAKKIEAKTIRDGLNDMKESLQRIGGQIERVARDMQAVQDHFHASAGNVLKILGKLRKNANKLQGPTTTVDTEDDNASDVPLSPMSPKSVTFSEDENDIKSPESEPMTPKTPTTPTTPKVPRKFKIIDPEYKGSWTVRNHIERGQLTEEQGVPNVWNRQETLVESDDEFDGESGTTPRGLRRRKTRMKKVCFTVW